MESAGMICRRSNYSISLRRLRVRALSSLVLALRFGVLAIVFSAAIAGARRHRPPRQLWVGQGIQPSAPSPSVSSISFPDQSAGDRARSICSAVCHGDWCVLANAVSYCRAAAEIGQCGRHGPILPLGKNGQLGFGGVVHGTRPIEDLRCGCRQWQLRRHRGYRTGRALEHFDQRQTSRLG